MELFRGYVSIQKPPEKAVVTIGNFDGVHLGHREIFRQTVAQAKRIGGTSVVFTFRPHPQIALRPEANISLLQTYDEKLELLQKRGLDVVIEQPFSREFSTTSPGDFFREVLLRRLSAVAIVVGYDFAFGKGREGGLRSLEEFCKNAGIQLTVVPPLRLGDTVVSSSQIRRALAVGQVSEAARLLGRPFSYRGTVVKGEGRGRKIGFATANLKLDSKLVLPYGVYATEAYLTDVDQTFDSVTNVGVRPTFAEIEHGLGELPALIETHLLGQTIDLYGRTLEVRFIDRIRDERKFSGIEALKSQIGDDVKAAAHILQKSRGAS